MYEQCFLPRVPPQNKPFETKNASPRGRQTKLPIRSIEVASSPSLAGQTATVDQAILPAPGQRSSAPSQINDPMT